MLGAVGSTPALAYGSGTNWQIGFAGTFVNPSTGSSFGFWGWCAFGGGGQTGDCQFAQYFHSSPGGLTCEVSLDISGWSVGANGDFFVSGKASASPSSLASACIGFFPGSANFSGVDSGIPAAPGHFGVTSFGGLPGELQIQVTQIP
jgi:hypothetical protein